MFENTAHNFFLWVYRHLQVMMRTTHNIWFLLLWIFYFLKKVIVWWLHFVFYSENLTLLGYSLQSG